VVELHTSGHADADTFKRLIAHVNPGEIIPVHTENAAWFTPMG
jgi:mRNA degradation ribonuclease J1/J2